MARYPAHMPMPFPQHLETKRMIFRPPTLEHAGEMFLAYAQDPEVARFMTWAPHESEAVTRDFLEKCIAAWEGGTAFAYVLTHRNTGEILGMLEARPASFRVALGYLMVRAHWGQGYMPEAVRALTATALFELGYFRVEAMCDTANLASARTLEKSGFVREGCLARYGVHPNVSPEPRDCWMYAKCR